MTTVSAVIPTYHRPERLRRAVASVLGQELPQGTELEVVVCLSDRDAAADVEAAEALAADPRVRVAVAPRPGPAAARNAGVEAAKGEVLAFIDDDCEAGPGWLRAGLAALEAADIVQGRTEPSGPAGIYDRTVRVEPPSWLWETCNLLARRSVFERWGYFDETVHPDSDPRAHFGEDLEWGWRAVRSGARAAFAPGSVVYHAVEPLTWSQFVAGELRLRHVPWLVRVAPEARRHYFAGYFNSRHHALVVGSAACLGLAGVARVAGARRASRGLALAGVAAYLWPWRHLVRDVAERAVIDGIELGALAYGSVKWRRLVL